MRSERLCNLKRRRERHWHALPSEDRVHIGGGARKLEAEAIGRMPLHGSACSCGLHDADHETVLMLDFTMLDSDEAGSGA